MKGQKIKLTHRKSL